MILRGASLEAQARVAAAAERAGGYFHLMEQPPAKKVMINGKPLMTIRNGKPVFVYRGN